MIQHRQVVCRRLLVVVAATLLSIIISTTTTAVHGFQQLYPTITTTTTTPTIASKSKGFVHQNQHQNQNQQQQQHRSGGVLLLFGSTTTSNNNNDDENELRRAAALTDYLARAHTDKLRAIATVEQQKEEQIRTLQNEVVSLQTKLNTILEKQQQQQSETLSSLSSYIPTKNTKLNDMNKDELIELVEKYIDFVSSYIVNASIERNKAVKAAEAALNQKWEDKLAALNIQLSPISSATSTTATTTATTATTVVLPAKPEPVVATTTATPAPVVAVSETTASSSTAGTLYEARNVKVIADASNSRWGKQEIQKIGGTVSAASTTIYSGINGDTATTVTSNNIGAKILHHHRANGSTAPTQYTTIDIISNKDTAERIIEADHGIASDGTIDGTISLTERIVAGAYIEPITTTTKQVQKQQPPAVPVPAAVVPNNDITNKIEEADHGIASDGTVDGKLSLLQRVLAGASLSESSSSSSTKEEKVQTPVTKNEELIIVPNGATPATTTTTTTTSNTATLLYELRNKKLVVSSANGATSLLRWGSKELNKIQSISNHRSTDTHQEVESIPTKINHSVYDLRNQKIVTATSTIGTSNRWGIREVEKIKNYASSSSAPTKVVSVVRMEDDTVSSSSSSTSNTLLFQQRNANIIAAAQIGKSRWGTREIQKQQKQL